MPPDAHAVHTGHGLPDGPRLKRIQMWLKDNGIDPGRVVSRMPVYVLPVQNGTIKGGLPWLIDVIVFHEYYENPDGHRERNFITNDAVMFQRTVPLRVPFPADPATADEGATRGQAEGKAAQEAPQEVVRPARQAQVPHTGQGACEERPVQGSTERIQGHAEEDPRQGHEAVPQPEEVRSEQEAVIGRKGEG